MARGTDAGVRREEQYYLVGHDCDDPVLQFVPGSYQAQDVNFADLRGKQWVAGTGHWLQEETPEAVSRITVDFLTSIRDR